MLRTVFVVLSVIMGSLTVSPASASAGADLSVGMTGLGHVVVPATLYTVSVTNNGPEPVTAATVVVQVAASAGGVFNPPACPYDALTDTLTCTFGPVAVGATVTRSTWVVFGLVAGPVQVDATAALTASSPADPDPANDTASVSCQYRANTGGLPPVPFRMFC